MKKLIAELQKLGWGYEEIYDNGVYVNGYQIHAYDNQYEVVNVWSTNLETKWYKQFKSMLNFVTDDNKCY
jgi:hypothetical protein